MQKSLKEIAKSINGEIIGNSNLVISGVSGIKEAREGEITFLANPKYAPLIEKTAASAVITGRDVKSGAKTLIHTDNPSLAFTKVVSLFTEYQIRHPKGIHPQASVAKDASLGKNVSIGPYAVIEEGVSVGDNVIIYSGCFIGHNTKIGKDSLIYPNVSIRENVIIGSRVIIHSGAVIGSDGFGYIEIEGAHHKIPQIGTVEIADDVEIGANSAIDRARFEKTIIGSGTKIDNLVHIAHNVIVGENSLIIAQAGISGSTIIGKGVILAGQAGLVGHITVGDGAIVAAQAGVTKSVLPNTMVSGYPAKPHAIAKKINACIQNLPRLYDAVSAMKKKIEELESQLRGKK